MVVSGGCADAFVPRQRHRLEEGELIAVFLRPVPAHGADAGRVIAQKLIRRRRHQVAAFGIVVAENGGLDVFNKAGRRIYPPYVDLVTGGRILPGVGKHDRVGIGHVHGSAQPFVFAPTCYIKYLSICGDNVVGVVRPPGLIGRVSPVFTSDEVSGNDHVRGPDPHRIHEVVGVDERSLDIIEHGRVVRGVTGEAYGIFESGEVYGISEVAASFG